MQKKIVIGLLLCVLATPIFAVNTWCYDSIGTSVTSDFSMNNFALGLDFSFPVERYAGGPKSVSIDLGIKTYAPYSLKSVTVKAVGGSLGVSFFGAGDKIRYALGGELRFDYSFYKPIDLNLYSAQGFRFGVFFVPGFEWRISDAFALKVLVPVGITTNFKTVSFDFSGRVTAGFTFMSYTKKHNIRK